jgi:SAM-dependent methyltransferase
MGNSENNVQYMYNRFRFGEFNYNSQRYDLYDFLFKEFVPQISNTDQVYDIGCGRGFFTRKLADGYNISKENIFSIDLSIDNIESLKKLGFRAKVGSNLSLDVESDSSDKTISNGVIHHTPDPDKCIDELVRITKNDGLIYLAVYSNTFPFYRLVWYLGAPFRYIYWNINKAFIENFVFSLINIFFIQPLGLVFFRKFISINSAKVNFMDQLITPYAHSFSRKNILNKLISRNCEIVKNKYFKFCLMDLFIVKVKK